MKYAPKQFVVAGQTYNKLTAISLDGSNKNKKNVWLCQCECGQRTKVIASYLLRGHTKSCGCGRVKSLTEHNKGRRMYPVVGQTYQYLTAVAPIDEKNKEGLYLWEWDCVCGTRTKQPPGRVMKGKRASCGCKKLVMHEGYAPFDLHYDDDPNTRVARRIWKKTYDDGCSLEDFMRLSQEPCHYCGAMHSNFFKHRGGELSYNGLDRKDSTRDHTIDNVVPCCKTCNIAKGAMSYEEFLAWNKRVYLHILASRKDGPIVGDLYSE